MTGSISSPDPLQREVAGYASRTGGQGFGRVVLLAAGDLLSFIAFAVIGRNSHGYSDSISALGSILYTAFPFAAGWFLVAPFLRAFSRPHTSGVGKMLRQTEIAWLCAWPVTLVLRWIFSADHNIPVSFALVILIANAVFLGVWRGVFAWVAGLAGRSGTAHKLS
ncbi:MAG: DUF3054 domain-containing protein [Ktedonobacterales bacterium]